MTLAFGANPCRAPLRWSTVLRQMRETDLIFDMMFGQRTDDIRFYNPRPQHATPLVPDAISEWVQISCGGCYDKWVRRSLRMQEPKVALGMAATVPSSAITLTTAAVATTATATATEMTATAAKAPATEKYAALTLSQFGGRCVPLIHARHQSNRCKLWAESQHFSLTQHRRQAIDANMRTRSMYSIDVIPIVDAYLDSQSAPKLDQETLAVHAAPLHPFVTEELLRVFVDALDRIDTRRWSRHQRQPACGCQMCIVSLARDAVVDANLDRAIGGLCVPVVQEYLW